MVQWAQDSYLIVESVRLGLDLTLSNLVCAWKKTCKASRFSKRASGSLYFFIQVLFSACSKYITTNKNKRKSKCMTPVQACLYKISFRFMVQDDFTCSEYNPCLM